MKKVAFAFTEQHPVINVFPQLAPLFQVELHSHFLAVGISDEVNTAHVEIVR